MDWKRGLTRIYVVLWVLFGIVGTVIAISSTNSALHDRRRVTSFLKEHPLLTLDDLNRLPLDSLKVRIAANRLVTYGGMTIQFPIDVPDDTVLRVLASAQAESLRTGRARGSRTFDYKGARAAGYSDAEITDYMNRERASGRDVRLESELTRDDVRIFSRVDLDEAMQGRLEDMKIASATDAVAQPLVAFARIWGLWAALCVALPALLLWTLLWITAGFATRARMA